MQIDQFLDTLRPTGRRVFRAGFSLSFDAIVGRTQDYLAASQASDPRNLRVEHGLGGGWLASASFATSDAQICSVCHQLGLMLCRANVHDTPGGFESSPADAISAKFAGAVLIG